MKAIDIILTVVILIVVAFAVWLIIKSKKRGSCHGDCSSCGACCERGAKDGKSRKQR